MHYEDNYARIGVKYGRLTYLGDMVRKGYTKMGLYECECGNRKYISIMCVHKGSTKSRGCLYNGFSRQLGLDAIEFEKLYNVWKNMKDRCYNPNNDRFYTYGKKGINVCDDWKDDFHSFAKWAVENGWTTNLSIERKNIEVGYNPDNCCFITMKEQARNKSSNVRIVIDGIDKCIAEWCEHFGVNAKKVYARYERGERDPGILFYDGNLKELYQ